MNQQNIWELKGSQLIKQIRRAEVVKQMLKHSKAKQILDIGCAEGFITNYLSQLPEILEHLPNEAINKGIAEVNRVLKSGGTLIVSVPYKEKITYTRCIYCGKLTPLYGHIQSFDENKLASLFHENYKVVKKKYLPNLELISCSKLLSWIPSRIWLLINDFLGIIRKGYRITLKLVKSI